MNADKEIGRIVAIDVAKKAMLREIVPQVVQFLIPDQDLGLEIVEEDGIEVDHGLIQKIGIIINLGPALRVHQVIQNQILDLEGSQNHEKDQNLMISLFQRIDQNRNQLRNRDQNLNQSQTQNRNRNRNRRVHLQEKWRPKRRMT